MNRFNSSENLISNLTSSRSLALTAPFVTDKNALVGYAEAPDQAYCANLVFCPANNLAEKWVIIALESTFLSVAISGTEH
jgi:hypothetical protein